MLDLLTDDMVHEPSQGTRRHGKAAFAMFLDHMNRCYKEEVTDPVFLTSDDGAHSAAEFMLNGTYPQTDNDLPPARGQTYRLRVAAFSSSVIEKSRGSAINITLLTGWRRLHRHDDGPHV